jgi:hypothetical protein
MALEKQLPTVKDPDLKQAAGAAIEKLKKEVADNS